MISQVSHVSKDSEHIEMHTIHLFKPDTALLYVTGFAKRGLIHASDFATLMRHTFICSLAMRLTFTVSLV